MESIKDLVSWGIETTVDRVSARALGETRKAPDIY